MAVHLPRIQNLVVGDAPPSPMRVCRMGDPGAVRNILTLKQRSHYWHVPILRGLEEGVPPSPWGFIKHSLRKE
jgi:hypothetical protein